MKKLLFLSLVSILVISCNDSYVEKKREGLKPYPQEEEASEIEESRK